MTDQKCKWCNGTGKGYSTAIKLVRGERRLRGIGQGLIEACAAPLRAA